MRISIFFVAAISVAAAQSPAPVQQPVWQMQESGTTAGMRGIDSVDGKVAWASGTGGTVLKTVDGGAHWAQCAVPDGDKDGGTLDFRGVQAWDASTAIVMASGPGDKSRLYRTTDGCSHWALLCTNQDKDGFWDAVSVADRNNFMILGDPVGGQFSILDTADGGKSWNRTRDNGLKSRIKEGAFAASNSSMRVNWVEGPAVFGTGGPSGARVFYECDTCKSAAQWTASRVPVFAKGEAAGIFSLAYRDAHLPDTEVFFKGGGGTDITNWQFIAVGGDYTKPNDSTGTAAWTDDSGRHWTASTTPPHGYRSTVQWSESIKAWITAGTNGSDISRDDGKTWRPIDNGNWNALSLPFIVGPKGRIARINPAALPSR